MILLKESLKKVKYFIQGNVNYYLFFKNSRLLPKHIKEQIQYRFSGLGADCIERNECVIQSCGCNLAKQVMSNKVCKDSICRYVKFKDKNHWELFKNQNKEKVWKRVNIGKSLLGI